MYHLQILCLALSLFLRLSLTSEPLQHSNKTEQSLGGKILTVSHLKTLDFLVECEFEIFGRYIYV